jgi:hypothetical protein
MNIIPGSPHTKFVMCDEFSRVLDSSDDPLKEALRAIDGVPNAAYRVDGDRVFVFDKLVRLVKKHLSAHPDAPLEDLAPSLVSAASVPAKEAVTDWGIMPEPYEVTATSGNGLLILHRPFNATLPGTFPDLASTNEPMAALLLGGVISGSGDFSYKGQPMSLRAPLDPAQLPPRPMLSSALKVPVDVFTVLGDVNYEPGFEPVSAALFIEVSALEAAWACDNAAATCHAHERCAEVWARTGELRLETLNDRTDESFEAESVDRLRALYPELSMLTDGSLYACFDSFQTDCCLMRSWDPTRNDDFLFYLLGMVAHSQGEADAAERAGHWSACALLHGASLGEALAFGLSAGSYASEIARLTTRLAAAMRFLAQEKTTPAMQGRPIITQGDAFRTGRKYSAVPMLVKQNISDLTAG